MNAVETQIAHVQQRATDYSQTEEAYRKRARAALDCGKRDTAFHALEAAELKAKAALGAGLHAAAIQASATRIPLRTVSDGRRNPR